MTSVLSEGYDRSAFQDFVASFLPGVARDVRAIADVSAGFSDVTSLGRSADLDLQIFEVKVSGSLDKRVAIAAEAFKLMKNTASYRSLVAFHSEDTEQWRLSLLTAKPTVDEGKVVTRFSSPKRFSYLLGPGSKLATPSKQLEAKGRVSDFEDLSQRFAVEVVNNEFYREIAKLYDELVGTDQIAGVLRYPAEKDSKHEFGVRLVGRVIFCWFLREKRSSAGTALIPSQILSREAADEVNYYHSTLAPLFFEVLNKRLSIREERFQNTDFATIPYLNGGLFSPDVDDYYKFDKVLQKSDPAQVDVPNHWLHKFFDLLEMYNFTVDENTSFDIDLSIDPEMLGRIFENLLARINPETGETVRKGTGSFYTPREIVEYMVDQSLSNYLVQTTILSADKVSALVDYDLASDDQLTFTDAEKQDVLRALSVAKILDPACGSGAFPIGILQKIVFVLQRVDPDAKQWLQKQIVGAGPELRRHLEEEFSNKNFDYLRKLGVIRESIYGVDIQPVATEISRLRCFLTLVVDQSVKDDAPNRGIEPLPNLDFKFVTANSLVKLGGAKSKEQVGLFEDITGINELKELRNEYFSSHNSERESLKLQFSQSQNGMLQRMISHHSHGFADLTQKVSSWNPFSHHATNWFDPEWMFGIADGFDIVIGNPPYYKENDDKRRFDDLRESECYQGKMDVWYLFGALGIDLLKSEGILCYIATNNWTTNSGALKFKNKVLNESRILQLVDFGSYFVFESSMIQTMVMLFRKSTDDRYTFDYRRVVASKPENQDMIDVLSKTISPHVTFLTPLIERKVRLNQPLTFSDDNSEALLTKIARSGTLRLTSKEVAQGIVFPQDALNRKSRDKLGGSYKTGDGVFVLRDAEINRLQLSAHERELLRPYYTSKQVNRYRADPGNTEWAIYTDSKYRESHSMDEYPALKEHLDQYSTIITSSNHPYGLHRARDERFFIGEKILCLRKSVGRPVFSYVAFDCYVSAAFYVIKTLRLDTKYLTGLLNSKLIAFWLKNRGKMQGSNYQIDKEPLLGIPIFAAEPVAQKSIADRVSEIYSSPPSTIELEDEVDALVYELYNLTLEEISTIEDALGAAG